jgi:hypothetical protein
MPANKIETRLQGALMETLYPLVELGGWRTRLRGQSRLVLARHRPLADGNRVGIGDSG